MQHENCQLLERVTQLNVSLNLSKSNYKPNHKFDNEILRIHKHSNYSPSILKQIFTSIEKKNFHVIIQRNRI